jgi:hypothetical protein
VEPPSDDDDDDDDDFHAYSPFLGPEDLCRGFPKYEYMVYLTLHALAIGGGKRSSWQGGKG